MSKRLDELERRLAALEDERSIRELLSRYAFNADLGRSQEWLALWADHGEYDFDTVHYSGRDRLIDVVTDPAGAHKLEIENRSHHLALDLLVHVDGNEAWCECYSVVLVGTPDAGYAVYTAGYNHFDFERIEHGWVIVRRLRRATGGAVWGGDVIHHYLADEQI